MWLAHHWAPLLEFVAYRVLVKEVTYVRFLLTCHGDAKKILNAAHMLAGGCNRQQGAADAVAGHSVSDSLRYRPDTGARPMAVSTSFSGFRS